MECVIDDDDRVLLSCLLCCVDDENENRGLLLGFYGAAADEEPYSPTATNPDKVDVDFKRSRHGLGVDNFTRNFAASAHEIHENYTSLFFKYN
jgi:hypothetical protein